MGKKIKPLHLAQLAVALALIFAGASHAKAKTVALPITIDYPLLKALVVDNFYNQPGQTALALDEDNGCRKITLSNPDVAHENSNVRFGTNVNVRAGKYIMGSCVTPVEWSGYIELLAKASFSDNGWVLNFTVVDSRLYGVDRSPAKVTGIVWNLIKTYVHKYFDEVAIDLSPPVKELHAILPPLFPPELKGRAATLLKSMRAGKVAARPQFVYAQILVDVADYGPEKPSVAEKALTEDEFGEFLDIWETWDSFLVFQISSMGGMDLSPEDRDTLLDTLLETRSELIAALGEKRGGKDLIREQFMSSWSNIAPILRKHIVENSSGSFIGYLAFFTASDALLALDKLGPGLGMEISRNGLLRLARLLNSGAYHRLNYGSIVNFQLRRALGLGPPLDARDSGRNTGEPSSRNKGFAGSGWAALLEPFFTQTAWAKSKTQPTDKNELKRWLPSRKNLDFYLHRVKGLLNESSEAAIKNSSLDKKYKKLFKQLVLSSAWQESCFRQFKYKRRKITYLRSYNRTSVGLMQINERVWRGIYDRQKLRWDIAYNARAGSEILELYLRRYAIRKMKRGKPFGEDTLARVVYAMYNGGPGQFRKFLKRRSKGKYYLSDRLFWEKHKWVKKGRWAKINKCLLGG